jgi:hypothetical protein
MLTKHDKVSDLTRLYRDCCDDCRKLSRWSFLPKCTNAMLSSSNLLSLIMETSRGWAAILQVPPCNLHQAHSDGTLIHTPRRNSDPDVKVLHAIKAALSKPIQLLRRLGHELRHPGLGALVTEQDVDERLSKDRDGLR